MNQNWTKKESIEFYRINRWGEGFFDVNDSGEIVVCPSGAFPVSIFDVIKKMEKRGQRAPVIMRFPEVLRQRLVQINRAFNSSIERFNYRGNYRCFFPAKVNPHREVLESAIEFGACHDGGVEVGSKAELLGVIALTGPQTPIFCNGFKDKMFIEMALRSSRLGKKVTIILERMTELNLVLQVAREINVRPRLGVRVKLASRSDGHWNASVGSRSKFGVSISELIKIVEALKASELLDCLAVLHFHPGSQVSNVRKIKALITEAARIYSHLIQAGVPLKTIDVGGGLAVDYTGDQSQQPSSKNYSLQEYANDVVYYIQQVCIETNVPQPNIVSESGRSVAAHHSLLVIPVIDRLQQCTAICEAEKDLIRSSPWIKELHQNVEELNTEDLSECFHDGQNAIEAIWKMFSHGMINLQERALAEKLFGELCRQIAAELDNLDFVPDELVHLQHQLADFYLANFSVFQAIPDAWALGQIFPVVPLHRLNEQPKVRAIIGDITCDSDGIIDGFLGANGNKSSMAVHELNGEPYYLGVFLIGAYQEALGDDHNLMGNFHVVNVLPTGAIEMIEGATTVDVLENVHHCGKQIRNSLRENIKKMRKLGAQADLESNQDEEFFENVMMSYTYLNDLGNEKTITNNSKLNKPKSKRFQNTEFQF